jgi:hypothetical protein
MAVTQDAHAAVAPAPQALLLPGAQAGDEPALPVVEQPGPHRREAGDDRERPLPRPLRSPQ